MRYLVDSDVLIDALNGQAYAANWIAARADERLAISLVPVAEVYEGAYRGANPAAHIVTSRR